MRKSLGSHLDKPCFRCVTNNLWDHHLSEMCQSLPCILLWGPMIPKHVRVCCMLIFCRYKTATRGQSGSEKCHTLKFRGPFGSGFRMSEKVVFKPKPWLKIPDACFKKKMLNFFVPEREKTNGTALHLELFHQSVQSLEMPNLVQGNLKVSLSETFLQLNAERYFVYIDDSQDMHINSNLGGGHLRHLPHAT